MGEGVVIKDEAGVKREMFEAAKSFEGARPGWAFKMGSRGLGYYRDTKREEVKAEKKEEKKRAEPNVKEEDEEKDAKKDEKKEVKKCRGRAHVACADVCARSS